MMESSEALSVLIASIYDAALDHARWPATLKLICEFAGGHGSTLFAHDGARPHATLFYNYNNDPEYLRLYTEKYIHMNPMMPAVTFQEVGRVFTQGELVSEAEYLATRFYKEFQKPQGIIDAMFVNLEKSGTSYMTMSLIGTRATGAFDAERRRRLALLVPHVRRSAVIGHLISTHETEKEALTAALRQVAAAVFLVDARGRIEFANEAGTTMLQDGTILRSEQGLLIAVTAGANQVLRDTFEAARDGDTAIGVGGVGVPLTSLGRERWLAHILPLTSGARKRMGAPNAAVAAVFVRKAGLDSRSSLETLSKLYKLTATEVRVLQGVVEIGGVPQIADVLGVAEATIKSHLRSLFNKTGLNRQSDLVKLVAEHASPFGQRAN
jgi:DNA-binding CsgD family transcriptional regulator/PAS domain-containing protein